ncbi:MAG: hypothetical protein U9N01_00265, partial [Euryarchaeota archaeon]|nr:hypothetical protein [Euryarchaeota archaeon]
NIQWTDMPVPKIQEDKTIQIAAEAGARMSQAAFDYQQKVDQYQADKAVTEYGNRLRKLWTGDTNTAGELVGGFSNTQGEDTNNKYRGVVQSASSLLEEKLSSLEKNARSKALLRMNTQRNTFMERVSVHNATQFRKAQEIAREVDREAAYKEFEVDPFAGWEAIKENAAKYPSLEERDTAIAKGMVFAVDKFYSELKQQNVPDIAAIAATEKFFKERREQIPESAEVIVSAKLEQKRKAIDLNTEANAKKERGRIQEQTKYQAGTIMASILVGGTESAKHVRGQIDRIMDVFAEPVTQGKPNYSGWTPEGGAAAIEGLESGLRSVMQVSENGYTMAKLGWQNMKAELAKDPKVAQKYEPIIQQVEKFVNGSLRVEYKAKGAEEIAKEKMETLTGISAATEAKDIYALGQLEKRFMSLPGVPAETLMTYRGLVKNAKKEIEGAYSKEAKIVQDTNEMELSIAAMKGKSSQFTEQVIQAGRDAKIKYSSVQKLLKQADKAGQRKVDPRVKKLESEVAKVVTNEDMYYNPRSRTAGFVSELDKDQKKELKEDLRYFKISPSVEKQLAVRAFMNESERWLSEKANRGKTPQDWYEERFIHSPGLELNGFRKVATALWNVLSAQEGEAMVPQEGDDAIEYQQVMGDYREQTKPTLQDTRGNGVTLKSRPQPPQYSAPIAPEKPPTEQDIIMSTVPRGHMSKYSREGVTNDYLVALEIIRAGRNSRIDDYDKQRRDQYVQLIMSQEDFPEWKQKILSRK